MADGQAPVTIDVHAPPVAATAPLTAVPADAAAAQAPLSPAQVDELPQRVEIPDGWASLHWKQVVALAKQIGASAEITFDDAKQIIADEVALRAAPQADDGLVAMTKNGDTLRINPATVDAHKKAGWKLA